MCMCEYVYERTCVCVCVVLLCLDDGERKKVSVHLFVCVWGGDRRELDSESQLRCDAVRCNYQASKIRLVLFFVLFFIRKANQRVIDARSIL